MKEGVLKNTPPSSGLSATFSPADGGEGTVSVLLLNYAP